MEKSVKLAIKIIYFLVLIPSFAGCIQVKYANQEFSGEWIKFNIVTQSPILPSSTAVSSTNTPIPSSLPTSEASPTTTKSTHSPSKSPTHLKPSQTPEPSSWEQGQLAFVQLFQEYFSLFILDLSTGNEPILIHSPPDGERYMAPQWSPNSNQIALFSYPARSLIVSEPTPGSSIKDLGFCLHPSWSPDATEILCQSTGELIIVDVETGSKIPGIQLEDAFVPAWSPSGDKVVYVIFAGERTSIWKSEFNNDAPVLLAGEAFENYAPSWSHDGQWIAYQSTGGSELSEIWIMDNEGREARRITFSSEGFWSRGPSWSPDDKWLAFVRGKVGGDFGEIYVVSIDGGEPIKVTNTSNQVYDWRVTWGE